jgi:Zn-dependent M16 (insulinase) family peptidase
LGKKKLLGLAKSVKFAVKQNAVNISEELMSQFPPIPDASILPSLRTVQENIEMSEEDGFPFRTCQVIRTTTQFVHLGLGINISSLSEKLRNYLVLFQELMFQSNMIIPSSASEKTMLMDYKEVGTYSAEIFTSHGMGVGFGNGTFSTSWCSQLLTIFTCSNPQNFARMVKFTIQVLMFTSFTLDRIVSIAKNLLTNISELKVFLLLIM